MSIFIPFWVLIPLGLAVVVGLFCLGIVLYALFQFGDVFMQAHGGDRREDR